jgi:hypothetical protein
MSAENYRAMFPAKTQSEQWSTDRKPMTEGQVAAKRRKAGKISKRVRAKFGGAK